MDWLLQLLLKSPIYRSIDENVFKSPITSKLPNSTVSVITVYIVFAGAVSADCVSRRCVSVRVSEGGVSGRRVSNTLEGGVCYGITILIICA